MNEGTLSLAEQIRQARLNQPTPEEKPNHTSQEVADLAGVDVEASQNLLDKLSRFKEIGKTLERLNQAQEKFSSYKANSHELREAKEMIGDDKELETKFKDALEALKFTIASLKSDIIQNRNLPLTGEHDLPAELEEEMTQEVLTLTQEKEDLLQSPDFVQAMEQEADAWQIMYFLKKLQSDPQLTSYLTHTHYQAPDIRTALSDEIKHHIIGLASALPSGTQQVIKAVDTSAIPQTMEGVTSFFKKLVSEQNSVVKAQLQVADHKENLQEKELLKQEIPNSRDRIKQALNNFPGYSSERPTVIYEGVRFNVPSLEQSQDLLTKELITNILSTAKNRKELADLTEKITTDLNRKDFSFLEDHLIGQGGKLRYTKNTAGQHETGEISLESGLLMLTAPRMHLGETPNDQHRAKMITELTKRPEILKKYWQTLNTLSLGLQADNSQQDNPNVQSQRTYYTNFKNLHKELSNQLPEVFPPSGEPYIPSSISTNDQKAYEGEWENKKALLESQFSRVQDEMQKGFTNLKSHFEKAKDALQQLSEVEQRITRLQKDLIEAQQEVTTIENMLNADLLKKGLLQSTAKYTEAVDRKRAEQEKLAKGNFDIVKASLEKAYQDKSAASRNLLEANPSLGDSNNLETLTLEEIESNLRKLEEAKPFR